MGGPRSESRPEHISSGRPEGRTTRAVMPASSSNRIAKLLQYILAQKIGIALALFGELDDAPGDCFVGKSPRSARRRAAHAISKATPMIRLVSGSNVRPPRNGVMGMMPRSGVDLLREPLGLRTRHAGRWRPLKRTASSRTEESRTGLKSERSVRPRAALSICSGDVGRAKITLQVIRPRESHGCCRIETQAQAEDVPRDHARDPR
jgi:hypothetical protein